MFTDSMTLGEARAQLFELAANQSMHCPCCRKHVKVYRRPFNSDMARTMIFTYPVFMANPGRWLDIGNYITKHYGYRPADYGKLEWWDMVQRKPKDTNKGKANTYRMTERGKAFTRGELVVPSHAIEYRSEVISFDGDAIDIRQALGKHFDYRELMAAAGGEVPA